MDVLNQILNDTDSFVLTLFLFLVILSTISKRIERICKFYIVFMVCYFFSGKKTELNINTVVTVTASISICSNFLQYSNNKKLKEQNIELGLKQQGKKERKD